MKRMQMMGALARVLCGGLALGGVLAVGTAQAAGKPGWIMQPPVTAGFLYGVGSAETYGNDAEAASQAKDRAKAEIVRQVEVQISAETDMQTTVKQTKASEQFQTEVRQLVQSRVPEFTLSHVSTVETYNDKDARTVYVLERLDVQKELADLRTKISDIEAEANAVAGALDSPEYAGLRGVQKLAGVLVRIGERYQLRARANKLRAGSYAIANDPMRAIEDRIIGKIGALRILLNGAQAEGGRGGELDSGIKRKLTERGLRLVQGGEADIIVSYAVKMDVQKSGGVIFAVPKGSMEITDRQGTVLRSVEAKAKGSSQTASVARARAIDKLAEALGEELIAVLLPE
ncbi:MAG: LPP20 family lipoprotein [Betaproteobacteria bacterium]|nr:LPP20 family lipoprotein [Betaproteobacteria bacterium]